MSRSTRPWYTRRARWAFAAATLLGLGLGYAATSPYPAARAADAAKEGDKKEATFEVYKDKAGEFRWRLRTVNTNVIASSGQGYKDKRDCLAGIESVKKHAPGAHVEEEKAP